MNKALYITSSNDKFGYIKANDKFELNFQSCLLIDVEANLRKAKDDYHSNSIYHCHYILKGFCEFGLPDGTSRTVFKNQFIIIPRGQKHCILNESSDFSKLRVVFDIKVKNDINGFYKNFEKGLQKFAVYNFTDDISFVINMLLENNEDKNFDYGSLVEAYSYSLIIETANIIVDSNTNSKKNQINDLRVENAMTYIMQNVSKPICVKDVASHVSLSEKQLTRIFMQCKNYTPAEYIRFTKFNLAVKLLLDTNMSIGEIAEETGFNSISGFVNFFVRIEKRTPTEYRRKMRIFKKSNTN